MVNNPFKLQKLKIHVYHPHKNNERYKGTFEVMFNPESYSLKYENTFQKTQGINTSSRAAKYSLSKPEELSVKLILDNTGVTDYSQGNKGAVRGALLTGYSSFEQIRGRRNTDIYKKVQDFLDLTTYMNRKIHQPNFLKVEWGDLMFECRLKSVDINYTLFNRSGQPLRAELDVVFIGDIQDSKRVKKENKNSPDLTHIKTVKSGDRLPLMANDVYSNSAYYIQLARANNLNNFRKLPVGTTIKFPPIQK